MCIEYESMNANISIHWNPIIRAQHWDDKNSISYPCLKPIYNDSVFRCLAVFDHSFVRNIKQLILSTTVSLSYFLSSIFRFNISLLPILLAHSSSYIALPVQWVPHMYFYSIHEITTIMIDYNQSRLRGQNLFRKMFTIHFSSALCVHVNDIETKKSAFVPDILCLCVCVYSTYMYVL